MENALTLPVFSLERFEVTLQKHGVVYAHAMHLRWGPKLAWRTFARERSNLPLQAYAQGTFEGLLMVVEGAVLPFDRSNKAIDPSQHLEATFLSVVEPFNFFPELVKFVNSQEEEMLDEEFDALSEKAFAKYGENGFGIGPYDYYPMVDTGHGTVMLNEYLFADQIEHLLPGDKVWLRIDEGLLLSMATPRQVVKPAPPSPKRKDGPHTYYELAD
ncbi:MAG: hypothetical protein RLZZ165_1184 [Bacteroidota bacterium]